MTRRSPLLNQRETVASISPDGVATAKGTGLATVLARGLGSVAASQIGVIQDPAGPTFP